jgi:flagellar biosynthetic protein FliP
MLVLGTLHLRAQGDSSVVTNAASAVPTGVTFSINGLPKPQDVDVTIQIVGALTLLSLAPSLLILMTSFPRVIIVFSLAKNALGVASAVPSQLVMGFSLIYLQRGIFTSYLSKRNGDVAQLVAALNR